MKVPFASSFLHLRCTTAGALRTTEGGKGMHLRLYIEDVKKNGGRCIRALHHHLLCTCNIGGVTSAKKMMMHVVFFASKMHPRMGPKKRYGLWCIALRRMGPPAVHWNHLRCIPFGGVVCTVRPGWDQVVGHSIRSAFDV